MDQPIGLVRDNPFVKNDLCMRARSLPNSLSRRPAAAAFPKAPASNGTLSGGLAVLRTSRSVDYPKGVEKSSAVKGTMDDADFDTVSTGSGSDDVDELTVPVRRSP
ncbi:hypothetical protein Y032_0028g1712 [Ancylostoma ceylanicum]|uniref:Uncharacterized protein n=1 Tax=Ancylostoma ceylanicum TaxID=53326 RepID=A0A016UUM6_9BILA|nr:hypothetical protein Y032_0028g1712 [Ancylostoma ceylanicum]